jgi:hypothetical protein
MCSAAISSEMGLRYLVGQRRHDMAAAGTIPAAMCNDAVGG